MSVEKSEPSWRQRRPNNPAKPTPPKERKSWRKKKPAGPLSGAHARRGVEATDPRRALYRQRIILGLLAMVFSMACVALIIYLLFRPRQTPLIAVRVTEDPAAIELPPNALAEEDYQRFAETFSLRQVDGRPGLRQANKDVGLWEQPQDESGLGREALLQTLLRPLDQKSFRPGGPRKDVILLYLSAHGAVDELGNPCLLLRDSLPTDSKSWLKVEAILDRLHDHPRFGSTSGVKKVLLLDANRLVAHEPIGLLHNGFAAALARLVEAKAHDDLFVVNSTSPGEVGWSSPLLQGSLFGFFVADGLNGQADYQDGDRRITLNELVQYVRSSVSTWVDRNRDAPQHPILLTTAEYTDFPLVYVSRYAPLTTGLQQRAKDLKIEGELRQRARKLSLVSDKYQRLRNMGAFVTASLQWAQLESDLAQLDQLLLAGSAYVEEYNKVLSRVTGALTRLEASTPLGGHSLAFVNREKPALAEQVNQRLAAWQKPTFDEWKDPLDDQTATALSWNWVLQAKDATRVAAAVKLIERFPARQPPRLLEAHYLRMLDEHVDPSAAGAQILASMTTRGVAEAVALPRDLRSIYWIAPVMATADAQRRAGEDELMIQSAASLAEAARQFDAASSAYQQAEELSEAIAQAYRLRDEAFAMIPGFVRWATYRTQLGERDPQPASGKPFESINRLIDQLNALTALLEPGAAVARPQPAQVENAAAVLGKTLAELKKDYADTCDYLLKRAPRQKRTRQLLEALAVPSLEPSVERERLRALLLDALLDRSVEISEAELAGDPGDKKTARKKSSTESSPDGDGQNESVASDRLLLALGDLPVHPLLKLTDRAALGLPGRLVRADEPLDRPDEKLPADERAERLMVFVADQGERLRRRIAAVEEDCEDLTRLSFEAVRQPGPHVGEQLRAGVSGADRLLRASAALVRRGLWREGRDPGSLLQALDQRWFYLWHAARTLDDFWGPETDGSYYFAQVSDEYLNRASQAGSALDAVGSWLGDRDLYAVRRDRIDAARYGVAVDPAGVTLHPDESVAPHPVRLSAKRHLPVGRAALMARKTWGEMPLVPSLESGDREEVPRLAVELGDGTVTPSNIEQRFRYSDLQGATSLEERVVYRGHVWPNRFSVRTPGEGHEVIVQRSKMSDPTARVEGADPRPMAIMFVFDCSYSMHELTKTSDGERQRFLVARDALLTVLQRLPEANYQVGVELYGHRVGMSSSGKRQVRSNPHPDLVPGPGLPLGSDVQIVRQLEPWQRGKNPPAMVYIRDVMNKVGPLGKTPLYFAIKTAITDGLGAVDPKVYSRHVIVITDGENEQEPTETNNADFTTLGDLKAFLRTQRDVRVDILGYDLRSSTRTLEEICRQTRGQYTPVTQREQVIETIENMVRPGEFSIAENEQEAFADPYPLGQLWTAPGWSGMETAYDVRVRGVKPEVRRQPIRLEGGEALEMQVQNANLIFKPYLPPDESARTRTQSGDIEVIARIAPRDPGSHGVEFPIALQSSGGRFTARPRHFWAEIKPMGELASSESDWPTFVFYDLQFEDQRPVPVIMLAARNWPEVANLAEVRLWLRMEDDIRPDAEFPIRSGMDKVPLASPDLPGVTFEVDVSAAEGGQQQVRVREIHDGAAGSVDLNRLRVQMVPPPDEIKHQYVVESRRVLHEFTYASGRRPEKLSITTRERLRSDGAITLDKPLTVRTEVR